MTAVTSAAGNCLSTAARACGFDKGIETMQSISAQGYRLLIAILMIGMSTSPAWAYLDPGTGSIVLQVLLGGVAGLLLAGKLYWHRLLTILGIRRGVADDHVGSVQQDIEVDAPTRK